MAVDQKTTKALAKTLKALADNPDHPIPSGAIEALSPLARPGAKVSIDLKASKSIGAPVVTIVQSPTADKLFAPLSKRQRDVAEHILEGRSNKDIASALNISIATVKDHVHAILRLTSQPSRSALIAAARSVT